MMEKGKESTVRRGKERNEEYRTVMVNFKGIFFPKRKMSIEKEKLRVG